MKIGKTTMVLAMSIALLTVMAGTAMANPATVTIVQDPIINPLDGTETTTTVTVTILDGDAGTRYISVISDNSNLQVKVTGTDPDGNPVDTGWATTTRMGQTYSVTANSGNGPKEVYTFTVHVKGTQDGEITVTDNLGNVYHASGTGYDTAECTRSVEIPEFATIALPLAATIGLFIFFDNRRKREEE